MDVGRASVRVAPGQKHHLERDAKASIWISMVLLTGRDWDLGLVPIFTQIANRS